MVTFDLRREGILILIVRVPERLRRRLWSIFRFILNRKKTLLMLSSRDTLTVTEDQTIATPASFLICHLTTANPTAAITKAEPNRGHGSEKMASTFVRIPPAVR